MQSIVHTVMSDDVSWLLIPLLRCALRWLISAENIRKGSTSYFLFEVHVSLPLLVLDTHKQEKHILSL